MSTLNLNREGLHRNPFWDKNGVIYEVHVRSFYDTDADGTGDFRGLTGKLDYELDRRPDWVAIPLQGILELVNPAETT